MLGGVARGAIPVSFTGETPLTMTAERIDATGLGVGVAVPGKSGSPTMLTRLPSATLTGLCESMTIDLPAVGPITATLTARTVRATDLVLDMKSVSGGLDAQAMVIGPLDPTTAGYRTGPVVLQNVVIGAGSVSAGSFTLDGLRLDQHGGAQGCGVKAGR